MLEEKIVHFVEWKKVADEDLAKTLHDVRSWGVTDIVAHPIWYMKDQENKGFLKKVAAMIKDADLKTPACHALWGKKFDFANEDEARRIASMEDHKAFLYDLAEMGVTTYTLHLGMHKVNDSWDFAWDQIRRSVDALLPVAEKTSIALALENGGEAMNVLRNLAELVKEYAHPQVGMCFDTGHANCYSATSLFEIFDFMKDDLVTCHMHDNYGAYDDHNPPGSGNIPWDKLIAALKACPRMHHAETESGDWDQDSWNKFYSVWK